MMIRSLASSRAVAAALFRSSKPQQQHTVFYSTSSRWLAHPTSTSIQTKFDLPNVTPTTPGNNNKKTDDRFRRPPQLTKIVATIGPTSEQLHVMQRVVRSGMRIMRLNFSHATREEVELRTSNLKQCHGLHSSSFHVPGNGHHVNLRAVLLDTRGPEIRTGKLRNDTSGHETISLQEGDSITVKTTQELLQNGSTQEELFIDYPNLHKCLQPGMKILLDDGAITLTVKSVDQSDDGSVLCVIDNSGDLRSRAGVNLPGAETDLPAMSEKDKEDIMYGMTKDVDYVAASFVQNAAGVNEIRQYMQECAQKLGWDLDKMPLPLLISKIESLSALKHFDEILEASDGIMVARGDLGVEIPIQQVTNVQKEMVAACNAVGKPVIVATQMLESMVKSPRPTRAEVSDVTNAVYDGADCLMLSGETAKGKYPVEAVQMMDEIIQSAEAYSKSGGVGSSFHRPSTTPTVRKYNNSSAAAIAKAAVAASDERGAAAILVLTRDGNLPRLVAVHRPVVPVVAFCPTAKMGRQLMIHRGIHPVLGLDGVAWSKRPEIAVQQVKSMGFVQSGDDVVVVTMEDFYEGIKRTATMKIATVP